MNKIDNGSDTKRRPVMLCILDGWGERDGGDDNAIYHAKTPTWDRMVADYPTSRLQASALDVGLPEGQMGNSEVGHMNLGAGRVVMQDLPLINQTIADNTLKNIPTLTDMIAKLKASGGACHLLGLISPGGVHSHQDHLVALAEILNAEGIPTKLHGFMDGRDTAQSGGKGFMAEVVDKTASLANFSIATVTGRYWALDRDNNWDRVERAYNVIVEGTGIAAENAVEAIQASYDDDKTDEFMDPYVIGDYDGMQDGDAVLMFNFRSDRAREIMACFVDPGFDGFERKRDLKFVAQAGMTEYSTHLNQFMGALFPQRKLKKILGEVISEAGLTQLRTAETEKYAHVTFFFNGGEEQVYPGEERILVPSPKVATYDLQPEMSAHEVTDNLVDAIENEKFDLIIVNYANGDMVGHTGVFDAAVKAAETIDGCLNRLEDALLKVGGTMLVTADHGNAEQMSDPHTHGPHTAHTLSPVPLILVNPPSFATKLNEGALADISPTLLRLLGLDQPEEMTGSCLISENQTQNATA
jgi:2,3-bisphosphoglycerate-independent phosphoglycerate mutase